MLAAYPVYHETIYSYEWIVLHQGEAHTNGLWIQAWLDGPEGNWVRLTAGIRDYDDGVMIELPWELALNSSVDKIVAYVKSELGEEFEDFFRHARKMPRVTMQ